MTSRIPLRISNVSVRTRIAALAAIPVVGFAITGFVFAWGQSDVERVFQSAGRASNVSEISREFQASVEAMRFRARDFAALPSADLIKQFKAADAAARKALDVIEESIDPNERPNIESLKTQLSEIAVQFQELTRNQQILGYTESEGVRDRMNRAAASVERLIQDDLTWMDQRDSHRLLTSLLTMRRYEAQYRLERSEIMRVMFTDEFKNLQNFIKSVIAAVVMKQELAERVKAYADAFAEWNEVTDRVGPPLAVIDYNVRNMMPAAEGIAASAKKHTNAVWAHLTALQTRTRNIILGVGIAAVLIGLVLSGVIARSIARPLGGLAAAMKQLAAGDTSARIPATSDADEIGDMARTVIVFRNNILERELLTSDRAKTAREREQRSESIAAAIASFRTSIHEALGQARGMAEQLESSSAALSTAADAVTGEATAAETRINAASQHVTAAAGSVHELAASISQIAEQASKSTEVAARAVSEARRTAQTMTELGEAATRIGEIIGLIQAIAGQTNLLALNATIEAARAGEAGRGFAVVASEVKSLAAQTAKATSDIASQVGAIQAAAADSALAISQVNTIITDMSAIASAVSFTMEEQNAAVASIAAGVNHASMEAQTGAAAMSRVAGVSSNARATAADVKSLADSLSAAAENLETEVHHFLTGVQAA